MVESVPFGMPCLGLCLGITLCSFNLFCLLSSKQQQQSQNLFNFGNFNKDNAQNGNINFGNFGSLNGVAGGGFGSRNPSRNLNFNLLDNPQAQANAQNQVRRLLVVVLACFLSFCCNPIGYCNVIMYQIL